MAIQKQDMTGKEAGTYRISELVASSGTTRDMIKYYLRTDLLPPTEKPRANLSLYTENHLKLIELIRKFQEQTKLSLQDIADVFRAASYDANAIEIELLSARHSVSDGDNIIPLKSNPQNTRKLNFPAEFLQQLTNTSLLQHAKQPEQDENQLAGLLWAAHNAGVPLAFFESAREKLAELADLEVKTLIAIKRPGLSYNDMVDNVTDVNRIINRWMITEKSRQIRSQFQRVIDNSERAISTLLDTIYQPSAIFRQRHGLDQMLANLTTELDTSPPLLEHAHALCFSSLLLGEYEQTITIAQSALAVAPDEPLATAFVALAHGLQNNVDLAFEHGSQLEDCQDTHPVILQARMLSLLLKASKLSGVADTAELMKSAGEIFLELLQGPSMEEPEAILTLARANVAFPDFANSRSQAINALQALLQRLEKNALELAELPVAGLQESLLTAYRICALYYLGVLLAMNDEHDKAAHFFEQVIQLDPASNFGKSAYLQLGSTRLSQRDRH
jgi:DNA-binding transcriptional MerR regulator